MIKTASSVKVTLIFILKILDLEDPHTKTIVTWLIFLALYRLSLVSVNQLTDMATF